MVPLALVVDTLIYGVAVSLIFESTLVLITRKGGTGRGTKVAASETDALEKGLITEGTAFLWRWTKVAISFADGSQLWAATVDKFSHLSA